MISLVEYLIGAAIVAMVLCFSLPFAPTLYKKNQLDVVESDIKNAIEFAKTQAFVTGHDVLLMHLPGADDWSQGMVLVVDNPEHQYTSAAQLLHEWHWRLFGIRVMWQGFQSKHYLLFSADMARGAVNGYFLIKTRAQLETKLMVNRLGRVRHA